jgi:hypothetical protein
MWRRVGGAISCAVWLLLACGRAEQGTPNADDSAGASTAGVTSASSGTGNSAGSAVSAGGAVAQAGNATSGGDAPNVGGRAEAGTAAGGGASAGGESSVGGAASCNGSYRACGCGCCVGLTPALTCVYPERGDDLAAIIAADLARRSDLQGCSAVGCSIGEEYVCCESPPPSAEQASYLASRLIGGIDRIVISKMTSDCSSLTLRQRGPSPPGRPEIPLETPPGWEFDRGTSMPCASSATRPLAIGALGTVSLRVLDDACVADVHLALFFSNEAAVVDAERFDVDALPIDLPVASCH